MDKMITPESAPALGDTRTLGEGDTVWIAPAARQRKDWSRQVEAIAAAVSKGAEVRWMRAAPETLEEHARREWKAGK